MEHIQRLYETTFIINGVLEDVHIEATIAKVQDLVLKNGCEIVTLTRWGRKRFAYPIKHKNNGYYVILEFKAFPEFAKELERFYHLDENILRHLTILVSKKMVQQREVKPFIIEQVSPLNDTPALEEIEIKEAIEELKSEIEVIAEGKE